MRYLPVLQSVRTAWTIIVPASSGPARAGEENHHNIMLGPFFPRVLHYFFQFAAFRNACNFFAFPAPMSAVRSARDILQRPASDLALCIMLGVLRAVTPGRRRSKSRAAVFWVTPVKDTRGDESKCNGEEDSHEM